MRENSEKISKQIRKNIFEILELWSSKESQLKYQSKVPIAQVSAELFCQWEDNYSPESEIHKMAFNEKERKILEEFNKALEIVCNQTPQDLPYITEFILTKEWIELNLFAKKLIAKIKDC